MLTGLVRGGKELACTLRAPSLDVPHPYNNGDTKEIRSSKALYYICLNILYYFLHLYTAIRYLPATSPRRCPLIGWHVPTSQSRHRTKKRSAGRVCLLLQAKDYSGLTCCCSGLSLTLGSPSACSSTAGTPTRLSHTLSLPSARFSDLNSLSSL